MLGNKCSLAMSLFFFFALCLTPAVAETDFFEADFFDPDGTPRYGSVPFALKFPSENGPPLVNPDQLLPGMEVTQVENGIEGSSLQVALTHALKPDPVGTDTRTRFVGSVFSAPAGRNEFCCFNPTIDGIASAVKFSLDVDIADANSVDYLALQATAWTETNGTFRGHEQVVIDESGRQTIEWTDTSPMLLGYLNGERRPPGDVGLGFAFFTRADVANGPVEFSAIVDNFSASIQTVPEPSAGMVMLVGIAGLSMVRRRTANGVNEL